MHLMSPAFTTTGKRKGKSKFRNAEAAARARQSAESWTELLRKYDVNPSKKSKSVSGKPAHDRIVRPGSDLRHIPSLDSGAGIAAVKEQIQYTGTAMIGIGQLHKSNAIPVFSQEDAIDISKMRRG
jgi:hypothetical protein